MMRARLYPLARRGMTLGAKPAPRCYDGQAYYDRHIRPFVERFGERNGPVQLTPIPPRREPEQRGYIIVPWRAAA